MYLAFCSSVRCAEAIPPKFASTDRIYTQLVYTVAEEQSLLVRPVLAERFCIGIAVWAGEAERKRSCDASSAYESGIGCLGLATRAAEAFVAEGAFALRLST